MEATRGGQKILWRTVTTVRQSTITDDPPCELSCENAKLDLYLRSS